MAAALAAASAYGQAPTFVLHWDAPNLDCPDEAHVQRAVRELLGGDDPATSHVDARARVERVAEGTWREHLTTVRDGTTGERVFDAGSCNSLADATALIVALAIDPQRVQTGAGSAATTEASATAAATTALAPEPDHVPPPIAARTHAPAPSSLFAAFAAISGDLGTLPRAAYGLHLGAALLFPRARLELYGGYWPAQQAHDPVVAGGGGELSLSAGGMRGCWVPLSGTFVLAACPGLELGLLHGQGTGLRTPQTSDGLWFAATILGRVTWRITRSWSLLLDVSLVVPFVRDTFTIDQQTIEQSAPVEGRASVGPELQF